MIDDDEADLEDDIGEVVGSCDECGVDITDEDDLDLWLCDQCSWNLSQSGEG